MRANTKRHLIIEMLTGGKTRRETYAELRPMVEMAIAPMIFSANVGGRRIPKPIGMQLRELVYEINRCAQLIAHSDDDNFHADNADDSFTPPVVETPSDDACDKCGKVAMLYHDSASGLSLCQSCLPIEKKPVATGKRKLADAKAFFLAEVRRIRQFCRDREMSGETLDDISMRPIEAGARLIPAGIPPEALLHAMSLHWSKEARSSAGIADFNVTKLSAEIMAKREIETVARSNGNVEKPHALFGYVLTLVENHQPVMTIGPAGTGKSHLAKQIADYLGCNYAECPMTPGATRGDLLGRHTIAGFISAEFVNIYSGGGIFNFEEIDAADPSMLLVLNNALSSNALYNPVNGEGYEKHEAFSAFATANTYGLGANRTYTGREKLDAATIDRWRMGRVFMGIDENVEASLIGL